MSELKRCPICNGEVKLMFLNFETFENSVWDESIGNVETWFKCYSCDSEFYHYEPIDIPEKQIEWWNTRKPMERIVERLEELSVKTTSKQVESKEVPEYFNTVITGEYINKKDVLEIVKEEGGL